MRRAHTRTGHRAPTERRTDRHGTGTRPGRRYHPHPAGRAVLVVRASERSRERVPAPRVPHDETLGDRKSTRLNSSHVRISYAVFCLKKKKHPLPHHRYYLSTDYI